MARVELELSHARIDELDVEGVLGFAEQVLVDAARLWLQLDLGQKQQFQQVLFPDGLTFDGKKFGAAISCCAYTYLQALKGGKNKMVTQSIPSWNQLSDFLREVDSLRRKVG
jgi:hypothetical protein